MMQETLSNPIEILSQVNPREFLNSLSKYQLSVFGYILDLSATCAYVNVGQKKMSDVADCALITANRAVALLKKNFVIHTTRRFNDTSYYYITPYILSDPVWREELKRWFAKVPKPRFDLSLLMVSIKQGVESTTTSMHDAISRSTEEIKNTLQVFFNFCSSSFLRSLKEGYQECHMSNEKFTKIRGIGLAIRKRGSSFTNDDCANLAAYHEDVLDKAINGMKGRKDLRNVAAYFLGTCKRIAQDLGIAPEWQIASQVKEAKVIFMKDDEDGTAGTPPKANANPEKIVQPELTPVTEDVFQSEPQKRERREPDCVIKSREVDIAKEQADAMILFEQAPVKNEFMQILATGWNKHTEVIEPEIIERPVTRAMFMGESLANRNMTVSDAVQEPRYDDQISNTSQDIVPRNVLESSGFKHFNPMAILKGFEYEADEEED